MGDPTYAQAIAIMKAEQRRCTELMIRAENAEREVRYLALDLERVRRAELAEARLNSIGLPLNQKGDAHGDVRTQ